MNPEEDEGLLTERYRLRSNEELLRDARVYDELTAAAQTAMRGEFARRSMEPPMVYDEEVGRPLELVTLARYRDLSEGIVARAALESAGIECFLRDENFVRLDWGYSNFIGGMRLQVDVADEAAALEILHENAPEEIEVPGQAAFEKPICPRCGSDKEVAYDAALKSSAVLLLIGSVFVFLWPLIRWVTGRSRQLRQGVESWHCMHCGCNWQEDDGEAAEPVR